MVVPKITVSYNGYDIDIIGQVQELQPQHNTSCSNMASSSVSSSVHELTSEKQSRLLHVSSSFNFHYHCVAETPWV